MNGIFAQKVFYSTAGDTARSVFTAVAVSYRWNVFVVERGERRWPEGFRRQENKVGKILQGPGLSSSSR
jgi:hypothetical protein